MSIWIHKGASEAIPRELDEAAIVGRVGIYTYVVVPLSRPALAAASIHVFVGSWNEFVAGSVMVYSPGLKPIQPLVYSFIGFFGREWGPLTASATLAVLPIRDIYPARAAFDPDNHWPDLMAYRQPVGGNTAERPPLAEYEQAGIIGGGSSINGQIANRGTPADYDDW